MLIIDELPFTFVEREGFCEFCKAINSHFLVPSCATATRDCYTLFVDERKKLSNVFQDLSSRVCLTTDTWTSLQNMSYMCLTAHFIDADEEKIESKSLVCMDVETRWNSTFLMLESASKFRKAFSNLLLKDSNCAKEVKKSMGGLITDADCVNIGSLLPFLKVFYEATLRFLGSRYITSNAYMHEIFGIGNVIEEFTTHPDVSIKKMAFKMQLKHNKYRGNLLKLNQFLFISLLLDPRRKQHYINLVVRDTYEKESVDLFLKDLDANIVALFEIYNSSVPQKQKDDEASSQTFSSGSMWGTGVKMDIEKNMTFRFEMAMGSSGTNKKKTELDKYLAEDRESNDLGFDILKWWSVQRCRYPVLTKMARDFLAIPVSTVASESAFSTGGRVLDSFRTSLTPRMVEAIVCSQDSIRASQKPIMLDETFNEIESMEEKCLSSLTMEKPVIIIYETFDESQEDSEVFEDY